MAEPSIRIERGSELEHLFVQFEKDFDVHWGRLDGGEPHPRGAARKRKGKPTSSVKGKK